MTDLAFWETFARSELILALDAEPDGQAISPQVFATSEGSFALAFYGTQALADFAGAPAPYAAMPGRALAALLVQGGYGLALDPGGAGIVLAAEDLRWLTETLATPPDPGAAAIARVEPPGEVPPDLLDAIAARVAPGLFEDLVLARIDEDALPLVAVIGPDEAAEAPLAAALSEALAFAGAGPDWQIGFFPKSGPLAEALRRHGMRLEITAEAAERPAPPAAPGSVPGKPPRLR